MKQFSKGYKPIADYGAIGDLRSACLVGNDGAIDWCCFPRFDSPSVFAAILDWQRGGRFLVQLAQAEVQSQSYIRHTNVLQTKWESQTAGLDVVDAMPLVGSLTGCGESQAEHAIYRKIQCTHGQAEVMFEWSPRFDYARIPTTFVRQGDGVLARSSEGMLALGGVPQNAVLHEYQTDFGPVLQGHFTLKQGQLVVLAARWNSENTVVNVAQAVAHIDQTIAAWRGWVDSPRAIMERQWASPWQELVIRSELTLKMMTYAHTGAIVAAPTTSLPETLGGVRNWDYRFTWIRDAAQIVQALAILGHKQEAFDFIHWAEDVAYQQGHSDSSLRIMYGIGPDAPLDEMSLEHFEGYQNSSPVRIGNEAYEQLQLDIYGELFTAVYESVRMGVSVPPKIGQFLYMLAEEVCQKWQAPDYGIWEHRNGPFHFVYSKVMVSVALKRAEQLAVLGHIPGHHLHWRKIRKQIEHDVLRLGFHSELNSFVQYYESSVLDAVNLLIPIHEFLPADDPRVQGTLNATLNELTHDDLVYRYLAGDGLPGEEGAFVLCTFWLVDALALSGRMDEAYRIFEKMTHRVNHLGLLSEQIEPFTGQFLGNFPQAYSHLGLINSVLNLAYMEGRKIPNACPLGTEAHRQSVKKLKI